MRTFAVFFLVCLVTLLPGKALGENVAGVEFSDRVTVGDTPLVLNGAGIRRVTILKIKVYAAGLYVRERTRDAAEILRVDCPKHYVAVMLRDVSREDSAPAFREGVERSAGRDVAAIRSEILAFEKWIPSMFKGQKLTATFTPGTGVVLKSTAKPEAFQGSILFGTALFGMWIGPRPTDTDLRAALLRGSSSSGS